MYREREMHKAICADCKKECEVPLSRAATGLSIAGSAIKSIDRRDIKGRIRCSDIMPKTEGYTNSGSDMKELSEIGLRRNSKNI